jgi:uncharacterized protein YndB with AHSA1/START domain
LHRVLAAKPEKVYRAFLEADALAKWLPPNGFACTVHHLEPRVGGTFKMSFRNFTTGNGHSFGGEYIELVPNERLRYTDKFDDPNLPGEIQVTVTLKNVSVGTELNIVQEGEVERATSRYFGECGHVDGFTYVRNNVIFEPDDCPMCRAFGARNLTCDEQPSH